MKTFPLMISKAFMSDHPLKGHPTYFKHKILLPRESQHTIDSVKEFYDWSPKIHTIRTNYAYWARIAGEVNAGRGILSLRQWSGSPYNRKHDGSKPVEFLQLTKMGIQEFKLTKELGMIHIDGRVMSIEDHGKIAMNDGLSQQEFYDWFKFGRKETEGCVIHFTDFRY
jgi:hypothetical protein